MPAFSALNPGSALNPRTLNPGTTVVCPTVTVPHICHITLVIFPSQLSVIGETLEKMSSPAMGRTEIFRRVSRASRQSFRGAAPPPPPPIQVHLSRSKVRYTLIDYSYFILVHLLQACHLDIFMKTHGEKN